jgi:hypothetical protein
MAAITPRVTILVARRFCPHMMRSNAALLASGAVLLGIIPIAAAAATASLDAPVFSSLSFSSGSELGSQRLAVNGTGFTTDHSTAWNTVELGRADLGHWVPCRVVEGACTVDCGSSSRIVCDTEPVPPELRGAAGGMVSTPLDVKVKVCKGACDTNAPITDEAVLSGAFAFRPARDSTVNPTLLGVEPRALSADEALSLAGSRFGNVIKDYRVVYVGPGAPPLGGNIGTGKIVTHAVCRPQALNRGVKPGEELQGPHRQAVMAEDFEPLDITPDLYRCQLGDFESGSYNVSVQLPQGLAWGNPLVETGLYSRDARGVGYQVQYYPKVDSLSPRSGSRAGGTVLTLRGHGFSMDEEDISIAVGADGTIPCTVLSSTLEEITCVTAAAPPATPAPNCTTGGVSGCAACQPAPQGGCAQCESGFTLVGNGSAAGPVCARAPPSAALSQDATAAALVGLSAVANSYVTDAPAAGGAPGWATFTLAVPVGGVYEVTLRVPDDATATACPAASRPATGAAAAAAVVYHSDAPSGRTPLSGLDLRTHASLGTFYFAAGSVARVVVESSGSGTGCLALEQLRLSSVATQHAAVRGCTDSTAANFEPLAALDDGSCLWLGGRGLRRQQWSFFPPAKQVTAATRPSPPSLPPSLPPEWPMMMFDHICSPRDGWAGRAGASIPRTAGPRVARSGAYMPQPGRQSHRVGLPLGSPRAGLRGPHRQQGGGLSAWALPAPRRLPRQLVLLPGRRAPRLPASAGHVLRPGRGGRLAAGLPPGAAHVQPRERRLLHRRRAHSQQRRPSVRHLRCAGQAGGAAG